MQLNWQKCAGDVWGSLLFVDLAHSYFDNMGGVYIIWQGIGPIIRVGQGNIRDRLSRHRNDPEIVRHDRLYVAWAPVHTTHRNGVERYLANVLRPVVGDAFPNVIPTPVSLPWVWQS